MMVRELAEKEIGPRAKENDEKDVFPVDIFKMMADMGLTGIGVPEEYGGPEATDIERMIAIEEIAKKDGAVATILAVHGMLIQALVKYGTEEQKRDSFPKSPRKDITQHSLLRSPEPAQIPLQLRQRLFTTLRQTNTSLTETNASSQAERERTPSLYSLLRIPQREPKECQPLS